MAKMNWSRVATETRQAHPLNPTKAINRPRRASQPSSVTARYAGTCVECQRRYEVGEPITKYELSAGWCHSECPSGAAPAR